MFGISPHLKNTTFPPWFQWRIFPILCPANRSKHSLWSILIIHTLEIPLFLNSTRVFKPLYLAQYWRLTATDFDFQLISNGDLHRICSKSDFFQNSWMESNMQQIIQTFRFCSKIQNSFISRREIHWFVQAANLQIQSTAKYAFSHWMLLHDSDQSFQINTWFFHDIPKHDFCIMVLVMAWRKANSRFSRVFEI